MAKALADILRSRAVQAWDAVPERDEVYNAIPPMPDGVKRGATSVMRGIIPPESREQWGGIAQALVPDPMAIMRGSGQAGQAMMAGDPLGAGAGFAGMALGAIDAVPGGRAVKSGAMALGKALERGPIRGYHGSPYNFDFFDSSKIGTGEGAQAYGRGHYIAEAEGVGRTYKNILGGREFEIGGRKLYTTSGGASRLDSQTRGQNIAADALDDAFNAQSTSPAQFAAQRLNYQRRLYPEDAEHIDEALETIADWQEGGGVQKLQGHMYEVNIHSDPNKFLDWDKRLFEQQGVVDAMYLPLTDVMSRRDANRLLGDRNTGEHLFRNTVPAPYSGVKYLNDLAAVGPQKKGAFAYSPRQIRDARSRLKDRADLANISPESVLQKAGIPGIRYLDGGSRAAGKGSSNYVVFDPKTIEIIRKYGIAGLLGGAGAAASQGADKTGGGI